MNKAPFPNMDELLQRLLDGQARPDEIERLASAILQDPQVRDYYIDSMIVSAVIRRSSHVTGDLTRSDVIRALSASGKRSLRWSWLLVYAVAAVLVLGGLAFLGLNLLYQPNKGPAIGVLADEYEARWQGRRLQVGSKLYSGPYYLRNGAARIEIGQGASLLLEGPCQLELKASDEVSLKNGRFVAAIGPQARGFRVRTLTALITDLGTQFGVIAHPDGSTEAHVIRGQIKVTLNPSRSGPSKSLVVSEGSAATVGADGLTLRGGLAARTDLFLLQIPSASQPADLKQKINLADIVGGGDGRGTGTLDRGIDLATGKPFKGLPNTIRWIRQDSFQPCSLRGIDGVFMPYGASGRIKISSTGLSFEECPRTTGSYYGGPANSGRFFDILRQEVFTARLNGIIYGTPRHPALILHPNAGITFDLNQIRQDNPDIEVGRFTAVCGIPKDLPHPRFSSADVWILLDGNLSFHIHFPKEQNLVHKVDIPIPQRVRFLTMFATCSGRADYSWVVFGDPYLGGP